MFFSRWPWSDLSRSSKVKVIAPFDSRPMTYYWCSIVTIALILHGNPVFQHMTLIWPFKVTKGRTDYVILFATYDFLSVLYSNYSAISHGNPVFQHITSIWPFEVTNVKLIIPFDRRLMTSYLQSIVTISLSRFLYEIFAVELLKTLPEIRHLTFSGSLTSTDSPFHLTIC